MAFCSSVNNRILFTVCERIILTLAADEPLISIQSITVIVQLTKATIVYPVQLYVIFATYTSTRLQLYVVYEVLRFWMIWNLHSATLHKTYQIRIECEMIFSYMKKHRYFDEVLKIIILSTTMTCLIHRISISTYLYLKYECRMFLVKRSFIFLFAIKTYDTNDIPIGPMVS